MEDVKIENGAMNQPFLIICRACLLVQNLGLDKNFASTIHHSPSNIVSRPRSFFPRFVIIVADDARPPQDSTLL